jgi:hypothetical protein
MNPLSPEQVRQFGRDGYLVVPGLVPPERVVAANAAIDALLADHEPVPGQHSIVERPPAAPELFGLLLDTPASAIAEQLTAPGGLTGPTHAQVALTFPPYPHIPGSGHIDGLNRLRDGRPQSFTLLDGVLLSDQSADDMGNVHVWPGTHRAIAGYARTQGIEALLAAAADTSCPPVEQVHRTQVHGRPGDVLFAHYLLAHNLGGNTSTVVRRTVYMRLTRVGHAEHWRSAFTDELMEYDGVRAMGDGG